MAKKLKYSDFFEDNIFKIPKDAASDFLDKLTELETGIKSFATNVEKQFDGIKIEKAKDIENLTKTVSEADVVFDAFNETQKERIKVEKELEKVRQEKVKTDREIIKNDKELEKVEAERLKTQREAIKNESELEKTRRERVKTDREIIKNEVESEKITQAKLKTEAQAEKLTVQRRKEAERLLKQQEKEEKQSKDLNNEYVIQSKRLNELRKKYKDLRLSTGENTEETEELLKEIQELDKALKDVDAEVGQFQRNVGNYPKVTESAKKGFGDFSSFLFGTVVGSFQKSRDEARTFNLQLEQFKNTVGVVAIAIGQFVTDILIPQFKIAALSFQNFIKGVEQNALKFQKTALEIASSFSDVAQQKLDEVNVKLKENQEQQDANTKSIEELSKQYDAAKNPFDGLIDRYQTSNKLLEEQLIAQDRLIDTTARLSKRIAENRKEQELAQGIADDTTKSFAEREEAIRKVLDLQKTIAADELTLAQEGFAIAEKTIKNDFIRRNELEKFNDIQEKGLLKSLEFLKSKQAADLIGLENLQLLTASTLELTQAETENAKAVQDANKVIAELKQDRLEKDLDILIDGFDNQKTINERLIADERKTFAERESILAQTVALGTKSFEEQIGTIQQFTDQQIDANDLLAESDAKVLNEKIRSLGLSEIIEGRLLEVIRDRRTAVQDLNDAEVELAEAKLERDLAIAESEQNIQQDNLLLQTELLQRRLDNEELTAKKQEEIIDDIYNLQKEAILDQAEFEREQAIQTINDEEEKAAKIKEIEEKAKNDVIRLEKEKQTTLSDIAKEGTEERIELVKDLANQTLSEVRSELQRVNDARREAIENEIEEREENITKQEELASKGLDNQLAFEQKKRDEAELEKLEQAKREQQQQEALQLAEAFLQAYINELGTGGDPALAGGKALASTLTARAIAKAIVSGSAYDGTEDTGTISGAGLDGIGGRLWMLHDNEAVISKEKNQKYKGLAGAMLNDDVGNWMMNNSHLMPTLRDDEPKRTKGEVMSSLLIKQIEGLRNDINSKPIQQVDVDGLGNLIEKVHHKGMKITTKYKVNKRI